MKNYLLILTMLLVAISAQAQTKTISGVITGPDKQPLPNVNITVNQSTQGTTTDANGRFSITVRPPVKLMISAAGFQTRTAEITASSAELSLQLEEDVARLDEVVVTGLATTVKRRNLANAVASISARELNGVAPAQTLDAALNGKITGAYINSNSGAPGGGLSIKLRGVTSVYGNTQPLYVVDGVFVDNSSTSSGLNAVTSAASGGAPTGSQDNPSSRIADLRAEDVENIEILKGASAAAIYGSKAAAGVVIITTKKGKQGKTMISASQDLGLIKARKLLGVREFNGDRAAGLSNDPATSEALRAQYEAAKAAGRIYDYEKEVYGNTGFARNSVVSISGGSEKTGFYLSASQKDEEGIVKRTGYRNTGIRLNLDHRLTDNIKIGLSTNYINSSADRGFNGNDNAGVTLGIALASTPQFAELHPDAFGNYPSNQFGASNPLQTIALMKNNEAVNRFITGFNIEATLQKNNKSTTRFIGRGGFDFYNLATTALFPGELQFQVVNKGTSIQGSTRSLSTNYILSLVNQLNVSGKVALTTSAGITRETGDYNNILNVATQVISGQSNIDQSGALTATQFRSKYQNEGVFVQEEAAIADAVILTGGLRFDRSSNNGDPGKYYAYPKAGVSWNLTRMGILKQGFINDFKLRAAFGQANNVPAYGSRFTSLVVSNINGFPGSLVSIQQGQPGIRPERQSEFETGIDFSVLDGRLSFQLTWYSKKITDFLMLSSLPSSSGFSSKWVNAGDLRNRGLELGMNARPVSTRNLVWNTTLNFWKNRSKVTRLSIPSTPQGSFGYVLGSFQIQEGKSATQILGLNGMGVGLLGDAEPDFQMNTYNDITFRNKLSLRFLMHLKAGGQNINLTSLQNDFGQTSRDFDEVTNEAGLPNGIYRISKVGTTAEEFVQNSGYMRLREIGLYYSFTRMPVSYIHGIRVGVSLNNWWTVTKYKSYDPEVSNFGTGFSTGVDVDPYPAVKRASFHLAIDL
ncbi:MAG: SusC/RagA family TonB-linked outer membrane protein [Chitinophagaceae bacterium]|nr:MAG: SusC/RagA family TonB-linked outer membrane protein [Chitinophagaceae bacterium]